MVKQFFGYSLLAGSVLARKLKLNGFSYKLGIIGMTILVKAKK